MPNTITRSYETRIAKHDGWNAKTLVQLSETRSLLIHTHKSVKGLATFVSGVEPTDRGYIVDLRHDFKEVVSAPMSTKATEKGVTEFQSLVLEQIEAIKERATAFYVLKDAKAA